ncbi:MAG: putative DNA-binding domain-containing protein [Sphingomonadales bacterium]|nr:putative DNA-binding domain-containing protein [Sphingomonadales bacterium]
MTLLERQLAFRDAIAAADDDAAPLSIGMEIYRDAYRGRLLTALEASFERTRRWVGDQAFAAAACHYVLTRPPTGWTLDSYGAEFPGTLTGLFADDPEVAELAWLEWQMQQAFAARDLPALDPAGFATAGYSDAEWDQVRFTMAVGFATRKISTNCTALWTALAEDQTDRFRVEHDLDAALVVWRKDLSPRWRVLDGPEANALWQVAQGDALGAIAGRCEGEALGTWLAGWLGEGILSAMSPVNAGRQIAPRTPRGSGGVRSRTARQDAAAF